jgi:hypothetical protein
LEQFKIDEEKRLEDATNTNNGSRRFESHTSAPMRAVRSSARKRKRRQVDYADNDNEDDSTSTNNSRRRSVKSTKSRVVKSIKEEEEEDDSGISSIAIDDSDEDDDNDDDSDDGGDFDLREITSSVTTQRTAQRFVEPLLSRAAVASQLGLKVGEYDDDDDEDDDDDDDDDEADMSGSSEADEAPLEAHNADAGPMRWRLQSRAPPPLAVVGGTQIAADEYRRRVARRLEHQIDICLTTRQITGNRRVLDQVYAAMFSDCVLPNTKHKYFVSSDALIPIIDYHSKKAKLQYTKAKR